MVKSLKFLSFPSVIYPFHSVKQINDGVKDINYNDGLNNSIR